MKRKKAELYTERQTVSLTPEQMRRLKELRSVRARKGGQLIYITDLIQNSGSVTFLGEVLRQREQLKKLFISSPLASCSRCRQSCTQERDIPVISANSLSECLVDCCNSCHSSTRFETHTASMSILLSPLEEGVYRL